VTTSAIVAGDALEVLRGLPDELFHCCATSPPYWGLRDYGVEGQLGLEKTPEEYVAKMVTIFREVRRVLRDDGVLWLNLGDCYAGSGRGGNVGGSSRLGGGKEHQEQCRIARGSQLAAGLHENARQNGAIGRAWVPPPPGLKQKDLVGVPWMVAFALRADGWYLRSDVIWHKPNPMPESTRGRPTKSHEYVFLLTKSRDYFFDDEAIAEEAVMRPQRRPNGHKRRRPGPLLAEHTFSGTIRDEPAQDGVHDGKRHVRSVWRIATTPFKEAHFAVMTLELARRLVRSGASERGCCPTCGAPLVRILQRTKAVIALSDRALEQREAGRATTCHGTMLEPPKMETLGWKSSCDCTGVEPVPCRVLDPFAGAGTTGVAAREHACDFVGIEINPTHVEMADRRIAAVDART